MNLLNKTDFDALAPNEQRAAICKDVIARLNAQKIVPNHGNFFINRDSVVSYSDLSLSVQESINTKPCQACAKGALFCSWVGNFNNVERDGLERVNEVTNSMANTVPELVTIFGREMLDNIEAAFEGDAYCWHYDEYATQMYAEAFSSYDLKGIMQYIVDNGGEFPLPADYNPYA
jgi:hypothetical protein